MFYILYLQTFVNDICLSKSLKRLSLIASSGAQHIMKVQACALVTCSSKTSTFFGFQTPLTLSLPLSFLHSRGTINKCFILIVYFQNVWAMKTKLSNKQLRRPIELGDFVVTWKG